MPWRRINKSSITTEISGREPSAKGEGVRDEGDRLGGERVAYIDLCEQHVSQSTATA